MKIIEAATAAQQAALQQFVIGHEYMCVGFSSQFSSNSKKTFFYAENQGEISAAFCMTETRLLFHLIPDTTKLTAGDIAPLVVSCIPYCISGSKEGGDLIEATLQQYRNLIPNCSWNYHLMTATKMSDTSLSPPLTWRCGNVNDLDAIFPLRKSYELVEVLPPKQKHNPTYCRKALTALLNTDTNIIVWNNTKAIAMACFNAMGTHWNQIGGVFTVPKYRNRGIASFMVSKLTARSVADNKGTVLFVKVSNRPALSAYSKAGFTIAGSYRILYYY